MTVPLPDATFATSDGTTIAYSLYAADQADAPRLALIHTLALDRSVWDGVVQRLSGRAHILTYDCRGHGRSDRRATAFTVELFARDLAELLDRLGWERVVLGGCSMGGCVAMACAGLFPARVSALALMDTTAWYGPQGAAQFRARGEAARAKGMKGLLEFQVARWFSDGFAEARPDLVSKAVQVFTANDVDCYAASCALLGDADLRPYLPALEVPVAVVVGEDDQATPIEMSRGIHSAIPHSTLTVLPRARHLTPIECPEQIAAQLLTLLPSA